MPDDPSNPILDYHHPSRPTPRPHKGPVHPLAAMFITLLLIFGFPFGILVLFAGAGANNLSVQIPTLSCGIALVVGSIALFRHAIRRAK